MSAALTVSGLSVRFGGVRAVNGIGLRVDDSAIVGLIGPNGAGKTTTIDAICGFVASDGEVAIRGRDVSGVRPHLRARSGISRTFQTLELFEDMTVGENLTVAAESLGIRERRKASRERAARALHRVGLDTDLDVVPHELPHGDRKLIAVARALIGEPALLLLDEPAAGLNSAESAVLGQRLRQLQGEGTAILLVDHDMGLVSSTCDHVYVLDFGEVIAEGQYEQILHDSRVVAAYLGGTEQGRSAS